MRVACIIPEKREERCHFCGKRIHWEIPEDIREGLTEEMLAEGADYFTRGPLNPDGSYHVGTCTFRRSPLSAAPASQAEDPSRRARSSNAPMYQHSSARPLFEKTNPQPKETPPMPTCRYCGREIYWETTSRGNRPINPDGTLHHRTCRKFHALKARERAQRAGLSCAVTASALPEPAENPNQMHFAF